MDKIFEMLGIEKLDETKQGELKETLNIIVESKAGEIAETKMENLLKEKKEKLVEEYETKFETYKEEITSKFSNFVDDIIDEEMVIPENVIKYAHLGELYDELIEQFKVRLAIDEDMIDEEVKNMLGEAKEEIETLRNQLDESKGQILEFKEDTSKMAAHIYLREKCDGLTEAQKSHVINILGDETVKESIDSKFNYVLSSMDIKLDESDKEEDNDDNDDDDVTEMECPECGTKATVKEDDDDKCPECGTKMKAVVVKESVSDTKTKDSIDESSAFDHMSKMWLNTLKTNSL
jgi:DNA-directed RNA polymerase subunit RPC12/RpoP